MTIFGSFITSKPIGCAPFRAKTCNLHLSIRAIVQNRSFFSEHFQSPDKVDFVSKSPIRTHRASAAFEFCIALRLSPLTSYRHVVPIGSARRASQKYANPFTSRQQSFLVAPPRALVTVVLVVLVLLVVVRASFDIVPFLERRRRVSFFEAKVSY